MSWRMICRSREYTRIFPLVAIILLDAILWSSAFGQDYEITALGTLGGARSGASQINNSGQVAGASTVQNSALHAFLWTDGEMEDLGVPGGYLVSSATALNGNGKVVGYTDGEYQSMFAYIWENYVWTYLGTLPGEGLDYSVASDINNNSLICGYSFTVGPGSGLRGWIWQDGEMTDLGALGGDKSSANAINEQGQIVGYAQVYDPEDYVIHAFIWEDGIMTDLGVLPGEVNSAATEINENGQIVGSSSHTMDTYPFLTVYRPCLWENGQIIDLGLPYGYARGIADAINDDGIIVGGMSTSLSGGTYHAFVWRNGEWENLNWLIPQDSGWELQTAVDINNNGQIVGSGVAPGGDIQAFLLNPVTTAVEDNAIEILPNDFVMMNNYPNPFNASTAIEFELSEPAFVTLEIYNILGRKIVTLLKSGLQPGSHRIIWDARERSSGVYYYRIKAGDRSGTRRMVLLK